MPDCVIRPRPIHDTKNCGKAAMNGLKEALRSALVTQFRIERTKTFAHTLTGKGKDA